MKRPALALLPLLVIVGTLTATAAVRVDRDHVERDPAVGTADAVWTADPGELDGTVLNPRGDLFGDGHPHTAQAPDGSWWAVWSFADRGERDIAVSRFDGQSWSPIELVVSGNERQDLDPRIGFLSNGQPVVVWWQKGVRGDRDPRVVAAHPTVSGWSNAQVLSTAPAWRPALLVDGDLLTLAWDSSEGIQINRFQVAILPNGMPADPSPFPGRNDDPDKSDDDSLPLRPSE